MNRNRKILLLVISACLFTMAIAGCSGDNTAKSSEGESHTVSQKGTGVDVDKYTMDLKLDTEKKTLSGTVIIDLTNHTKETIPDICIRNYAASILKEQKKGNSEIHSVTVNGNQMESSVARDPSVIYVKLQDKKLKPGQSISLKVDYLTDIPKVRDRFGYYQAGKRQNYLLSFCFPQLAMYEAGKWKTPPYISGAESTCNNVTDYRVRLETEKDFIIAASGEEKTEDGITTITAENMRDMVITASNNMDVKTETAEGVKINHYTLQYDGAGRYNNYAMEAAKDAVKLFTERFGKYPYEELDMVQCFDEGGMEYPGLILVGLPDIAPAEDIVSQLDKNGGYSELCLLVAHETAHQWFYGAVGNDQFEEPWLDESFAEFCESMVFGLSRPDSLKNAMASDEKRFAYYGSPLIFYETEKDVEEHLKYADEDQFPINKAYDEYKEPDDYSWTVYQDGALFLYELKKSMGEENFYEAMKEYYRTYCLKIATGEDFLKIIKKYDDSAKTQKVIDKYIETSS